MTGKIKNYCLIALFIYLPFHAGAWGMLGHRIVGGIAENYLTAKARAAIQKILGTESIAMASNWADFIKSDPAYSYLNSWHYIDLKAGFTSYNSLQTYLQADTATDAYTKLNFLVAQLKNSKLAADKKLLYLRLLIHIAEDLHQPMHVRDEEQGGNKIIVMWFNQRSNLHSVWDEQLIDYQRLSYTEYVAAINHPTTTQRTTWLNEPTSRWIWDSYQIADPILKEITQPEQKLSFRYNFDHVQTLNTQLLKGGLHLAGLLNGIFG
ncbi:MAG: S1/P1 nuclease [Williamsia sp.]|nr:S1/P1 nuclease [Williamsia sp.]